MRALCVVMFASLAIAQVPSVSNPAKGGVPGWRSGLMGIPDRPAANTTPQDVDQFTQNVQMATPYFATMSPDDVEANREMVRRMWTYVMSLEMMSKQNPALRTSANRARSAMNAFPIGYNMVQMPAPQANMQGRGAAPHPPAKPAGPPFSMTAPPIEHVAGADRTAANELTQRYESTASRASVVWQNAETLRMSLVQQGMSLNAATAASVNRLNLAMDAAARALEAHNWTEAGEALDRANGEIEKIGKVVGH